MDGFLIILLLLIVLAVTSMRWGYDSRDKADSLEWLRRQEWPGFH